MGKEADATLQEVNDMIPILMLRKVLGLLGGRLFRTEEQEPNLNVAQCCRIFGPRTLKMIGPNLSF